MEINPIYNRFCNRNQSFETTLRLLRELISERLTSDYRSISVQGCNSGRVTLWFTIFFQRNRLNERGQFYQSYELRFDQIKNFRNWRPDGELGFEVAQIENLIEYLRQGTLSGIIS